MLSCLALCASIEVSWACLFRPARPPKAHTDNHLRALSGVSVPGPFPQSASCDAQGRLLHNRTVLSRHVGVGGPDVNFSSLHVDALVPSTQPPSLTRTIIIPQDRDHLHPASRSLTFCKF